MLEAQCEAAVKPVHNGHLRARHRNGHEKGIGQILSLFQDDLQVGLKEMRRGKVRQVL